MSEADDDFLACDAPRGCRPPPRPASRSASGSRTTTSLAPPCLGPRSAPIAPVIAEYMSEPVPAMTRAGERRCIEFVLGVEDERRVHRPHPRSAGGVLPCSRCRKWPPIESSSVSTSMRLPLRDSVVPVEQHRAEATPSAGRRCRARRRHRASSLSGSTLPSADTAGAHHVHRMRGRGQLLERRLHRVAGNAAQRLSLVLYAASSARGRQLAVHEQVGDFLELAGFGDIEDVVAAVVQVVAGAADGAQRGVAAVTPESATDFFGLGRRRRARRIRSSVLLDIRARRAWRSLRLAARTARRASARTRDSRGRRTAPGASASTSTTLRCVPSRRSAW